MCYCGNVREITLKKIAIQLRFPSSCLVQMLQREYLVIYSPRFTDFKCIAKAVSHDDGQAPVAAAFIQIIMASINVFHGVFEISVILSQCPQSIK